jgi:hypothetical protein
MIYEHVANWSAADAIRFERAQHSVPASNPTIDRMPLVDVTVEYIRGLFMSGSASV